VSGYVFCLVLLAAVLHASWNAIVKGGGDKWLSTILVAAFSALASAPALLFLPAPAPASWPFLLASTVCQCLYFVLLARAYRLADLSQVYPLMRGCAPLLVTAVAVLAMGEVLPQSAFIGIGAICAGILAMACGLLRGETATGVPTALLNALVIAAYTLIDGVGVRRAGSPLAYLCWLLLLTGLPLMFCGLAFRGRELRAYLRRHWRFGLAGGIGSVGSYGVALWAMTQVPVAMVAALRETSILFGALISWRLLHERIGAQRLLAVAMIAVGAMALRLG